MQSFKLHHIGVKHHFSPCDKDKHRKEARNRHEQDCG